MEEKKKTSNAIEANRTLLAFFACIVYHLEVEMEPRFSSPFGQGELYATINECLPPPPLLPPPNQDVRDCKIDCTEMSDDTPLNAVNPESEHFRKSLTVDMNCSGALRITTANTENDYLGPVPRQTEPSFTTVSALDQKRIEFDNFEI